MPQQVTAWAEFKDRRPERPRRVHRNEHYLV